MLRISSYTFGCKLNQSETEAALTILAESGYDCVPWDSGADLYLINTCTVTTKGEQKARRLIRQVQQLWPQAVVLATGCYAVLERQKLETLGERVCALPDQPAQLCQFLARKPVANSDELLELLRSSIAQQLASGGRHLEVGVLRGVDFPEALLRQPKIAPQSTTGQLAAHRQVRAEVAALSSASSSMHAEHTALVLPKVKLRQRFFLKIQDGCNRTCSFCRIRIARGPSRSLPLPLLLEQLQRLEAQNYREVVITGVHINSYHYRDETSGRNYFLGELLQELLAQTQHLRLRLSSLEPEDLESNRAQALLRALASSRICPHFHISIQSGSEYILRQMRRCYTALQQMRYIERLKELRPNAFFSCDVIVGFPGEREEDFAATYALLHNNEFAAIHGFSYSPRPGTDAFDRPKVQDSITKERMARLQALAAELQAEYLRRSRNQIVRVLLEKQRSGYWYGYSENYIRTRITAAPNSGDSASSAFRNDWQCGDLVTVRLQPYDSANQRETVELESQAPEMPLEETTDNEASPFFLEGIPLELAHSEHT